MGSLALRWAQDVPYAHEFRIHDWVLGVVDDERLLTRSVDLEILNLAHRLFVIRLISCYHATGPPGMK